MRKIIKLLSSAATVCVLLENTYQEVCIDNYNEQNLQILFCLFTGNAIFK